jgi:hypothetical protein
VPWAGDTGLGVVIVVVAVVGEDGLDDLSPHVVAARAATTIVTVANERFLRFIDTP